MCVFVLVGASFSLNEGFLLVFYPKKNHTIAAGSAAQDRSIQISSRALHFITPE